MHTLAVAIRAGVFDAPVYESREHGPQIEKGGWITLRFNATKEEPVVDRVVYVTTERAIEAMIKLDTGSGVA